MKRKLKMFKERTLTILADTNRKGAFQILKELIAFGVVKKEMPYFYFAKFLYRKEITNYKDYLSRKQVDLISFSKNLHHFQYASILRNKLAFAFYMEKNNLPVPKMMSYNLGNRFFFQSNVEIITDKQNLIKYFKTVFVHTGHKKVFVKAITEMGGTGAYLITEENLEEQINVSGDYILANDCIHQEVVIQHELVNKIYAHSVNTIRFDTYMDKNDEIHIISGYMRFGAGGSVLDNSSSGGFYVTVDIENGKLIGKSHQFMRYGGEQSDRHPDTGVVFEGYKIPYFEEACKLVKDAVTHIPDRIIGWDIAIGKDGPLIIEGNDNNSLLGPDIAYGGLLKHPLFKEILEEA